MEKINQPANFKSTWLRRFEQESPRLFGASLLALTVIIMVGDYTFGEWTFHHGVQLWKEPLFWSDMANCAMLPVAIWLGWKIVSLGRLKIARFLLGLFAIICAGDAILYSIPNILESLEKLQFHLPISKLHWETYWDWQRFWKPAALVIGNLLLLRRWWLLFIPKFSFGRSNATSRRSVILESLAITAASAAVLITAVHWVVPQMPVNDATLSLAETFLVRPQLKDDFGYLAADPIYHGKRMGAILDHVELADLQRKQFYPDLDEQTFRQFILSPEIDDLPLDEVDWRRTLWENFYPRVRHENDPVAAAQIVVRFLRERVGIDPSYHYRVGVETIWTEQMADETGFNRVYVAALRSVGIAARLNTQNKTELWNGREWQAAPNPPVVSFTATD